MFMRGSALQTLKPPNPEAGFNQPAIKITKGDLQEGDQKLHTWTPPTTHNQGSNRPSRRRCSRRISGVRRLRNR